MKITGMPYTTNTVNAPLFDAAGMIRDVFIYGMHDKYPEYANQAFVYNRGPYCDVVRATRSVFVYFQGEKSVEVVIYSFPKHYKSVFDCISDGFMTSIIRDMQEMGEFEQLVGYLYL